MPTFVLDSISVSKKKPLNIGNFTFHMAQHIQKCLRDIMNSDHLLQTTVIKQISQKSESHTFFGFPVHTEVVFTLHCSLLCAVTLCLKKYIS